jgi:hypothetical protein
VNQSEAAVAQRLGAITVALSGAPAAGAPAGTPVAPRAPRPEPVAAAVAPATADEGPGLVGSYQRYDRMVAALGLGGASLDDLLAGPPAMPTAAPARVSGARPAPAPEGIVSISDLLYSGTAATQRLTSLRDQVRKVLAGASPDGTVLKDLIEEVFDLVDLGAGRER